MPLTYEEYKKQRLQESPHENVQRGFMGEIIPTAGQIIGGIGGAALTKTPTGAIAGSALGGAAGEAIQQTIEKGLGQRKELNQGQIAATGVTSGLLEGGFRAGSAGIKAGYKTLGGSESLVKTIGKLSGFTPEIIGKAFERGAGVIKGVTEGESGLSKVILNSIQGIQKLASETLAQSQKMISNLSRETKSTFVTPIEEKVNNNFIAGLRKVLFEHNIQPQKAVKQLEFGGGAKTMTKETLDFNAKTPSRIISGGEQGAIQEAWHTARNILKNKTIKGINAGIERLIALRSKTPAGTPTGGETKLIIGKIIDSVKTGLNQIPEYGGNAVYQDYLKFLDETLPKRIMIEDAKDIFGSTAHPSAAEVSKITTRMLQMYNAGRGAVREGIGDRVGIEQIGKEVGQDITGTAAGALMKVGEQFSVRAPQLTRRAMMTKIVEYLPRKAILNYVKTGQITGELLNNPIIKTISATTGLTGKAILQEAINLLENKSATE